MYCLFELLLCLIPIVDRLSDASDDFARLSVNLIGFLAAVAQLSLGALVIKQHFPDESRVNRFRSFVKRWNTDQLGSILNDRLLVFAGRPILL